MWLRSQGKAIEILKPVALREEMKEKLQEMLKKYGNYSEPRQFS